MTDPTRPTAAPDSVARPTSDELIDASPMPLVVIDQCYTVVAVNQRYCEHYGVRREDVIGRPCHEVSHGLATPCSGHGEQCPLETALATGRAAQAVHVHMRANGTTERVQLEATPVRSEGAVRWVSETVQPLTELFDQDLVLVGQSPSLLQVVSLLQRVASTDTTVLLLGESGTGKERAAQYVHAHSARAAGPFVVFDCGGFSETLLESELFGYEKGAFTGAISRKVGLFEAATGGTIFIDEIGDLPLPLQGRLLRVLESGSIRRVGGTEYLPVDVRIVAATNRDLEPMVREGRFREDLLFRLSAFPIRMPTLRDRMADVPALATQFLARLRGGHRHLPLAPEVAGRLTQHDYPGNVRELRNVIERAVILAHAGSLRPEHIVFDTTAHSARNASVAPPPFILRAQPSDDEILAALARSNGHRGRAAEQLGINERTLYRYLTRLRKRRGSS